MSMFTWSLIHTPDVVVVVVVVVCLNPSTIWLCFQHGQSLRNGLRLDLLLVIQYGKCVTTRQNFNNSIHLTTFTKVK